MSPSNHTHNHTTNSSGIGAFFVIEAVFVAAALITGNLLWLWIAVGLAIAYILTVMLVVALIALIVILKERK